MEMTDQELDRRIDLCSAVADENGFDAIWSIYEVIESREDFNNVIYPNGITITYTKYGDNTVSVKLDGPTTVLDMFRAADRLLKLADDDHHVYIEGFTYVEDDWIRMNTGS